MCSNRNCYMKTRIWIKLYLEILDDPKMDLLPDWLWRRAIELFLLAGENGNDVSQKARLYFRRAFIALMDQKGGSWTTS